MSANVDTATTEMTGGAAMWVGAGLVYLGLAAIAVSTVWTTNPLAPYGVKEKHTLVVLGVALLAVAAIGRSRLAVKAPAKLLCALGIAACMRFAVDPTFEQIGTLGETLPMWILDAYPGLGTVGWIVLGAGGAVWWLGKGRDSSDGLFRTVAIASGVALVAAAVIVRVLLAAWGCDMADQQTWMIVWRIVEVAVPLVVIVTVSGERKFAHWPMVIVGIALLGHVAHLSMGGGGEA